MTFSIITPSFGQSEWLKLCVASVMDQNVSAEHIVQDGGSADGTLDWLLSDPRIRAFVERDSGIYDALNRGLYRACGEIVGFLNCDEQYLPGALSSVAAHFDSNPQIQIIFGQVIVIDGSGEYRFHRKVVSPQAAHTWTCPLATFTGATFVRRAIVDDLELFFDVTRRYCGDAEWVLRLLRHKLPIAVMNQFTSAYTLTGRNLSLTTDAKRESATFFRTAPILLRMLRPLIVTHYRLRRLWAGAYIQKPFQFSVYTRESPDSRVIRNVMKPSWRWNQKLTPQT
jgi:glycosyltransferase involved in cell wall biosynthesis